MDLGLPTIQRVNQPEQQQRPSILYFIFLSILFFLISNNNPNATSSTTELNSLQSNLNKQIHSRNGLSTYLGLSNHTHNATTYTLSTLNQSFIHSNLDKLLFETTAAQYEQNMTGFIKASYHSTLNSLSDSYNITTTHNSSNSIIPTNPTNSTTPIPSFHLINTTTTHNRTINRNSFAFNQNGNLSFNLREEQTSATGNILLPQPQKNGKLREGDLLQITPIEQDYQKLGPILYLRGDVTIINSNDQELLLDIEAVHFVDQGTIYGYATPPTTRSHLLLLPALANYDNSSLTSEWRNLTSTAIGYNVLKELDRRIATEQKEIDSVRGGTNRNRNNGNEEKSTSECIFSLYGRLSPFPVEYTKEMYATYYNSLSHPSTAISPPVTKMNYILSSDNCNLVLTGEGSLLSSLKLWERVTTFAYLMAGIQGLLLWRMIQQIEISGGSAGNMRISWLMVALQIGLDSYFFIICFTVGLVTNNRASLPLLVPAFFSLLSSLLFGMRWAGTIRAATPPRPTAIIPPVRTRAEITARAAERRARGETEIIPALLQPTSFSGRASEDFTYLSIGFGFAIFSLTIIFTWGWLSLLTILLYSYWLPQIIHNITRSSSRLSLSPSYLLSATFLRLLLPLYLYTCPVNILSVKNSKWIYLLIFYNFLLLSILLSQERYGTRWFLSKRILEFLEIDEEIIWNYFPTTVGGEEEEEGLLGGGGEKEDCPICMEGIEEEKGKKEEEGRRFGFMVPPCGHIAHTTCLENWMEIKSICPVCRRSLPPL